MKLPLILALVLGLAAPQDKTYDLSLNWKPVAGHKSELAETSSMKMVMKITGQPEPVNMAEETAMAATQEVVTADDKGGSERLWKFSKAMQSKEGPMAPLSFQGKTVALKHTKGQPREFSLDKGELSAEDVATLRKAFMIDDEKPGEPSGSEVFAPKKPVKVGESWSPDIKAIVKGMFDAEMAEAVDLTKSKVTFTLKSVEARSGIEFAKIEGSLELGLGMMGPMKLDTPLQLKMTFEADHCIDGKVPDGAMSLKADLKGKSSAAGPAGKIDIDLDMSMKGQTSTKTVK